MIVDKAGYIVTNFHVVNGARSISVRLSDGRVAPATVVGADDMTDLAVLKIDLPNLIAAEWGDSDELEVGDLVWALGSPFGLERSLTFGIVSAKSRRSGTLRGAQSVPGVSADRRGRESGQQRRSAGQHRRQGRRHQRGHLRPVVPGHQLCDSQQRRQREVRRAQDQGPDRAGVARHSARSRCRRTFRSGLGLAIGEGVFVGQVEPEAPAERAGVQAGDVILKWNDHAATDPTLLSRAIAATKIGSTAKVRLVRVEPSEGDAEPKRSELEVSVEVERHPDSTPNRDAEE